MNNPYIKVYKKWRRRNYWASIRVIICCTVIAIGVMWLVRDFPLLFWAGAIAWLLLTGGFVFLIIDHRRTYGLPQERGEQLWNEAKKTADEFHAKMADTIESRLGKPDIALRYDPKGVFHFDDKDYEYLDALFPWHGEFHDTSSYEIYRSVSEKDKQWINDNWIDYDLWKKSKQKPKEYLLLYKEKGILVVGGEICHVEDIESFEYETLISRGRPETYQETITTVDRESRNRRMAAGHMVAGMKGVYLSALLPEPTVTTTRTRTCSTDIAVPMLSFTMKSGDFHYFDLICVTGKERVDELCEYLKEHIKV
ncbi:MAG: hypothetical protein Q4B68_08725 [Bacteroidales bacterium]|nr:hypothetical protein [Bacteroidales bacterium]